MFTKRTILLTLLCAGTIFVGFGFVYQHHFREGTAVAQERQTAIAEPAASNPVPLANRSAQDPKFLARYNELLPFEKPAVLVYENCNKSVVNINTKSVYHTFSFFSSGSTEEIESERGSGIILDKKGNVLTNFHVVEGSDSVQVTLFNGKTYSAEKIGEDPITDIAVLKIDAPENELFPVELADSSQLLVGQSVYAIGNPFGLERTLTSGIISSLNRTIGSRVKYRPIKQVIQIDAAINPGNSGGPLLDSRGRMIGINTAIASRVGENSGVGFAIPSNTIQRIVPQLLKEGKVIRAEIGIVRVQEKPDEGLVVRELLPDGAAERAGLQGPKVVPQEIRRRGYAIVVNMLDISTADIIVAVDEQPTKTTESFLAVIESHKPGDRVVVSVLRKGKTVKIPVLLD